MKPQHYLTVLMLLLIFAGCSGGRDNPVMPPDGSQNDFSSQDEFVPQDASDVIISASSRDTCAYKAFGIYHVIINPATLTGEIIPTRKAEAIGDTFDADLTQFLTVSPCPNCLQINGIQFVEPDMVVVGFAVRHPFDDIVARPDLHGFDIRGIVIANGNYNFPNTMVEQSDGQTLKARANTTLVMNPHGYTHHFDGLAADENYFYPPLDYNANINPYRRYFVDASTDAFDPHAPVGHNVMGTGAEPETQDYIFKLTGNNPLDFVFVVDCAYGHSATYQNRPNPYYFLPEYNRKEAWKVDVTLLDNPGTFADNMRAGDTGSELQIQVEVCDWQAGLISDPDYPNTDNLDGISAESDVASVTAEVSNVSALVEVTSPDSGSGTDADPYVYTLTLTNQAGIAAGTYYGIVAVRDDLQGEQGPMGIPENPNGFPYEGPEITDYTTYMVFSTRVSGAPPSIDNIGHGTAPHAGQSTTVTSTVTEPDGDDVTFLWEQISPTSGRIGTFDNPAAEDTTWQAPWFYDVPEAGIEFILQLTASDADGIDTDTISFMVKENNSPPVCMGIETIPFHGVIPIEPWGSTMDISINAMDPDSDDLGFEWDMDWDLDTTNFDVDNTGSAVSGWSWASNGFYETGCRIFEDGRDNQKETFCSRTLIQEGHNEHFGQIDNSREVDPEYWQQDIDVAINSDGGIVSHVVWNDVDDKTIHYTNNNTELHTYGIPIVIDEALGSDVVGYPQVAAFGDTVVVLWLEEDADPNPDIQFISCVTSLDGGETFSAEINFNTIIDPEMFMGLDVCSGSTSNEFYMTYQVLSNIGTFGMYPNYTLDAGLSWSYPSGSSYSIRDHPGSAFIRNPTIEYSPDVDVIHVFWEDTWLSPDGYFYDFSTDHGESWNGNVEIGEGDDPDFAAMSVADNGDAFFAWYGDNGLLFSRSVYNAGAPWVTASKGVYGDITLGSYLGLDIWNSPSGKTVVIFVNRYFFMSGYFNHYCYSINYGEYFNVDYRVLDTDNAMLAKIDGGFLSNPDRIEVASACINKQSSPPDRGHIKGDFFYLAERF
ncbi:hypothetical protein J7L05_02615 [bacterium]|nr:hypothetical protein [bacterium]